MNTAVTYLDYNATAPLKPQVAAAMRTALDQTGNPSSVHRHGRLARRLVEEARDQVAALVGVPPRQVVFTSGGTEANAMALAGLVSTGKVTRLVVSAIEHASVLETAAALPVETVILPCTPDGVVEVENVRACLAAPAPGGGGTLISVMAANNETGVIQPVGEIARAAAEYGAFVHCDAVQAVGKIPVRFAELGVHMLSLSAHKLGGPMGVGALVMKDDLPFAPLVHGGGQEMKRRAGTENLIGIVGFGKACALAAEDLPALAALAVWRDRLERGVLETAPEAVIFGRNAQRLGNTSCFALPGLKAETQVMALDLAGVSVSAGAACSSGKVTVSHVLQAMGAAPDLAAEAIRVSFGWNSREDDIDRFLSVWNETCVAKRRRSEGRTAAARS